MSLKAGSAMAKRETEKTKLPSKSDPSCSLRCQSKIPENKEWAWDEGIDQWGGIRERAKEKEMPWCQAATPCWKPPVHRN